MKTLSLCAIGLAAGFGLAAVTHYPVLETLGYAPEEDTVASVEGEAEIELEIDEAKEVEAKSLVAAPDPKVTSERGSKTKLPEVSDVGADKPAREIANVNTDNAPKPKPVEERTAFEDFDSDVFSHDGFDLPYRLRIPNSFSGSGTGYSLVVFLHGAGERGDDNESHLKHGSREFTKWIENEGEHTLLLFPQCPEGEKWADHDWSATTHSMSEKPTKSMAALLALLDEIIANEQIDESRIYATGLSMGGFGVYDLVARRPDMFAAAAPICGGTDCSPKSIKKLSSTPLYIVHGSADTVVDVSNSRHVVNELKQLDLSPVYRELPGVNHDSWTETFADDSLFKWMFMKERPKASAKRTAQKPEERQEETFTKAEAKPTTPPKQPGSEFSSKAPSIAKDPRGTDQKQQTKSQKVVVAKPAIKDVDESQEIEVERAKLDGKWLVVRAIHAGSTIPVEKLRSMTIEFEGNQIIIQQGSKREIGQVETRNSDSIGETVFAELKITSTQSGKGEIRGFYYFDADELTMIWGAPGAERPDPTNREELAQARILTLQATE